MRIAVVERVSHASSAYRTFAATAAMLAGGLSAGGAKWAEVAAEREAQLVIARDEQAELTADPAGERAELAAYWESRGLSRAPRAWHAGRALAVGNVFMACSPRWRMTLTRRRRRTADAVARR